jgi:hypothetical protein
MIAFATADHHSEEAMPPDIPIPAAQEAISKLPAPLQPSYNAALQVDQQTRPARHSGDPAMMMAAGQQMGQAIKVAMQSTLQFLGSASAEDANSIAGVLHFFGSNGQPDGPAPPGSEAVQMAQHMLQDAENMIAGVNPGPNMTPPTGGDSNMPPMPPTGGDPNNPSLHGHEPPSLQESQPTQRNVRSHTPPMPPTGGDPNMPPMPPMPPTGGDPNTPPMPPTGSDPNMMPPMPPTGGDPNMIPPKPPHPFVDHTDTPTGGDPNMMPPMPPTGGDPNMIPPMPPTGGDPNMMPPMPPTGGDPNMIPPMPPTGGDPNMMPPMGDSPMSPDGALLVAPGMFDNVAPECSDDLRNSELLPQETGTHDGITGNLIFRTVCNSPGWENNAITLPAGRNASHFGIEAATTGKVFFGVGVDGGANSSSIATGMYPDKPVWTTADGKAAFEALHLTSAAPSATGKYVIMIDPAKSDPGARVTVRFVDH